MGNSILLRPLSSPDLHPRLLESFRHRQFISRKWVNRAGQWEITDAADLREREDEKRAWIPEYLRQQIDRGGSAIGAFSGDGNRLVGFAGVDGILRGESANYANLTMLFVDDDWKRQGIGSALFLRICAYAGKMQAERLFISAIPSCDTVAFYFRMGCRDANEKIAEFVDTENDRYLEYKIKIET